MFIMYVNESIESTHRECVLFQGSNFVALSKNNISPAAPDLELILFLLWYWPIMNTHTKQQDKVFETDFIDSQKSDPICAPFGTKSYIILNMLIIYYFVVCIIHVTLTL